MSKKCQCHLLWLIKNGSVPDQGQMRARPGPDQGQTRARLEPNQSSFNSFLECVFNDSG